MGRALPIIIPLVLAIYAVIDWILSDSASVRGLRKPLWLLVILLLPLVGPIVWLIAGRPRQRPYQPPKPAQRPVAPDDDPEFLRQMREIDAEHERLLKKWESDLRRREEELRRRDDNPGEGNGSGTDRTGG